MIPKITRPALRYHGSKFRKAPWIMGFFPEHDLYVETHGGGGAVLLLKKPSAAECYNDLDDSIVNIFRVLRDPVEAAELQWRVELTLFSRKEFDWSYLPAVDAIDSAHKLIVRSFMGHGSDSATRSCRTGFRCKVSCTGRGLPSIEWASWSKSIPAFTARLKRVAIECRRAEEVIVRMDSPSTLFYVDPPYVHSSRSSLKGCSNGMHGYRYEMSDENHIALAEILHAVKGFVVLSGYASDLYERLYGTWYRFESAAMADGARKRIEVVWLNDACFSALESKNGLFDSI
jgi:DNA adenine methylase